MTDPHAIRTRMTFEEYLAFAGRSDQGFELMDGVVYAMSSGTSAHNAIAINATVALHPAAERAGCRVFSQGFVVRTRRDSGYVPDVVVICEPLRPDAAFTREPCLIVEVLSPSTARIDFGEKLRAYKRLPTLQAYWIVETRWRAVHRHWRDAASRWRSEEVIGAGVLPVPCPAGVEPLSLDVVYRGVPADREPPPLRRVYEDGLEFYRADVVGVSEY